MKTDCQVYAVGDRVETLHWGTGTIKEILWATEGVPDEISWPYKILFDVTGRVDGLSSDQIVGYADAGEDL